VSGESLSSEGEVEGKLNSTVEQSDGIVFVHSAYSSVDRLNSFFRAAKNNGQCLAVSRKQTYMLNARRRDVHPSVPSQMGGEILTFRKSKKHGYHWEKETLKQYPDEIVWMFEVSK
jgi:mRNA degradation ribonuclease J1/J2